MTKIEATILKDSVNSLTGSRLTTFELTYPRFIHSEVMTHRKFSRNSASSRAIPTKVLINMVDDNPVVPIHWGKLQSGMQAEEEISYEHQTLCEREWLELKDKAVESARFFLEEMKVHKQIVNRLLEPWMHITIVCTSDEDGYKNFFKLRCHKDAEPHIQALANEMRKVYEANQPQVIKPYEWHLPYADNLQVSAARCARLSYLNHLGKKCKVCDGRGCERCNFTGRVPWEHEDDMNLAKRLAENGHFSPFEHQVMACHPSRTGVVSPSNLVPGWLQYRKMFNGENGLTT